MSIDIERLKVDAAYWDEVAPVGAAYYMPTTDTLRATWVLNGFDAWVDVRRFADYGDDAIVHEPAKYKDKSKALMIPRPQPSTASLLTDEQAEARIKERRKI